MNWTPITFEELKILISNGEHNMDQNLLDFWDKIKTVPKNGLKLNMEMKEMDFG